MYIKKLAFLLLISLSFLTTGANATAKELEGFVSIKAKEANIRTGPSVKYPIKWIYKRKHWPVKIVATFESWRKIEDIYGEVGWIHNGLLSGKIYVVITDNKDLTPALNANNKIISSPYDKTKNKAKNLAKNKKKEKEKSVPEPKDNAKIIKNNLHEIYRLPLDNAGAIQIVENGVVAELLTCKGKWCKIAVDGKKGWILREYLWGV